MERHLFFLLVMFAGLLSGQTPADRYRRCPDCFAGGPVYTNYPTQVRPPAYYPPVYYGGYGYRVSTGRTVAAMAAGAGMAIVLDEIQQRRAEAAERRRDRQQPVQLRNCRVYESSGVSDIMVCEDRDGNRITLEKER